MAGVARACFLPNGATCPTADNLALCRNGETRCTLALDDTEGDLDSG